MRSFGLTLALLLIAPLSRGQEAPSPSEIARARALFAEAAQDESHSDWPGAAAKLREALAIKQTPGLYYHLAHCEEQLGALVEAGTHYERAAALIRAGDEAADVEPLLPAAERRIEAGIATLTLVAPADLEVSAEIDGRSLAPAALASPIRLDPGQHRIVARAPGRGDFVVSLSFGSGEHKTLKVSFRDAPVAARLLNDSTRRAPGSAPPPPDTAGGSPGAVQTRSVLLISEGALALTGAGVGLGFALARRSAAERVHNAQAELDRLAPDDVGVCSHTTGPPACQELKEALDDRKRAMTVEAIGFATAGVAAGMLVATWALWPTSHQAVSLEVQPRADGALVLAGGTF